MTTRPGARWARWENPHIGPPCPGGKTNNQMKKNTYIIVFLLLSVNISGQQVKIRLQGEWGEGIEMLLNVNYGIGAYPLCKDRGPILHCTLPDSLEMAVLGLGIFKGGEKVFERKLLYSGTDLALSLKAEGQGIEDIWQKPGLNKEYGAFKRYRDSIGQRMKVLTGLYTVLLDTVSGFHTKVRDALDLQKTSYTAYTSGLMKGHTKDAFGSYVKNAALYFPRPGTAQGEMAEETPGHFFEVYEPLDPLVLHSPLYKSKLEEYLRLIETSASMGDGTYDNEKLISALDKYLTLLTANENILDQTTQALWDKYHHQSMDIVAQHLDENWIAAQCRSGDNALLQERLMAYKRLADGMPAPDITFEAPGTEARPLSSLWAYEGQEVVLVFWASWCPHCEEMLPKAESYLDGKKGVQVIAIGLDEDEQAWGDAKKNYGEWMHIRAAEGWESPEARDYAIYATPTFYVIDEKSEILGKANNLAELKKLVP